MPAAHPMALRERVVHAYLNNEGTYEEIADRFSVGEASVSRWLSRMRNGHLDRTIRGTKNRAPRKIDEESQNLIRGMLEQLPDRTIKELVALLERERHIQVSLTTMARFLKEDGYTRKRGPCDHRKRFVPT